MLTTVAWILALVGTTAALRLWRRQREQLARRQAMDAEHARFLAAAESSLNAFAIVDAVRDAAGSLVAFRFSYVNSNAERLAGQSRQQIIGQPLEAVLRPGSAATLGIILRRVVETGEPLRGEQRFSPEQENQTWLVPRETPPGSNASVWIRYHAVRLGDGVAITCSNITAAKEVEVQHRQLAEFNRSIFENAPFSMIALDREGVITAVNLAA
ncbi:MAG: PAS domain-containing protein, partial [Acidobacteriota bacterium]|nr:PAS domain-containing protein [Acidobacteriota bacterium]